MKKYLLFVLPLLLTGCQQPKSWYKEGASNQDFSMDMGQCKAQAFGISQPTLLQIAIVQNQCMFGKGWSLITEPPVTSTSAPQKNYNLAAHDSYNDAFNLLNQKKYEEAANAFDDFIKQYPHDSMVGNAYYWEGETYYVRRDYVKAADNYRLGYNASPEGSKAADNLFKLALSLDALKRDKEACVVLQQIVEKFKSSAISQKADEEQKRIDCE